jgi:hypothetical protein
MSFNDEIVVGDYENGNIYAFDLNIYADNNDIQKWLRSWRALPTGANNLRRTAQHALQLDCETGVGLDTLPNVIDQTESEQLVGALLTEAGDRLIAEDGNVLYATVSQLITMIPRVMLRWSDDGGHTWSNEHWKSMGRIGQYGFRTIWRRLGMTLKIRDRVYEVSGTDPVKISVMGAELLVSPTNA